MKYVAAVFLVGANTPPSKAIDDFVDTLWFWIPLLAAFKVPFHHFAWPIATSSENAVRTQIWTALIAMLVLKFLQIGGRTSSKRGAGSLAHAGLPNPAQPDATATPKPQCCPNWAPAERGLAPA